MDIELSHPVASSTPKQAEGLASGLPSPPELPSAAMPITAAQRSHSDSKACRTRHRPEPGAMRRAEMSLRWQMGWA